MKTVLAPLHLHGVGTPAVESLASFFCRLADVHQVGPSQLGKVVCNDSPYLQFGSGPQLSNVDLYPAMFCSYSVQTEILVCRLEKLTGAQNLACGTLLRLRHVLSSNQIGSCVRRRRWCPACYALCEDMVVEPLAWSILVMSHCPIHGTRLQDQCSRCGSYQRDWPVGPRRKSCTSCDAPLSVGDSTDAGPTPWEIWSEAQTLRLLKHTATPNSPDFVENALPTFLKGLAELSASGRTLRRLTKQERGWARNQRHRLASILAIAARWGTTPLDILLRPQEAVTPSLFQGDVGLPAACAKHRYNKQGYRRCEQALQRLLRLPAATLLPPVGAVCRECAISHPHLQERNPQLCKRYGAERHRRAARAKARRVAVANSYATRLLRDLCTLGQRLHRKNAVAEMMRDIHVSKAVARSALRVALARMSVDREKIGG